MTAQVSPPQKPSHRTRNIMIAVVVVVLLLAAIGASGGSKTAAPSATPIAAAPAAASAAPAASVAPTTLLSLSGSGIKSSKSFSASGDSVDVAYAFDCANFGGSGNFQVMFYGASALGPTLPDILANALSAKGTDTTTEYLNGATGPFHIEINSECDWTVKVTGTP